MEELINQEKKDGHCFRDCLKKHCHNCGSGHKIIKIIMAIVIAGLLISIGAALGRHSARWSERGDFSKNGFYRGGFGAGQNFQGDRGDRQRFASQQFRMMRVPGEVNPNINQGCPFLEQLNDSLPPLTNNSSTTPASPNSTSTSPR